MLTPMTRSSQAVPTASIAVGFVSALDRVASNAVICSRRHALPLHLPFCCSRLMHSAVASLSTNHALQEHRLCAKRSKPFRSLILQIVPTSPFLEFHLSDFFFLYHHFLRISHRTHFHSILTYCIVFAFTVPCLLLTNLSCVLHSSMSPSLNPILPSPS